MISPVRWLLAGILLGSGGYLIGTSLNWVGLTPGSVPDYRPLAGSLGILAGLLAVTPWCLMVIRERRRKRRPPT
jgi:hypothetical protein